MTYLVFLLWLAAIFAAFLSVNYLIDAVYNYFYTKSIMAMFKNKNTQQLFVDLRPYIDQYMDILKDNTNIYAKQIKTYQEKQIKTYQELNRSDKK